MGQIETEKTDKKDDEHAVSCIKTTKAEFWDPILENNGMPLSIQKKSLFVKKMACHDFRE
jgi:catabolite regulation protein CreA